MLGVVAPAPIVQHLCRRGGQVQRLIQLPVGQQSGVGSDLGPVKFQLQVTVKRHSQSRIFTCTRQIFGFLVFEHREKPLFMRFQYKLLSGVREVYLGNPGSNQSFILQALIVRGRWLQVSTH